MYKFLSTFLAVLYLFLQVAGIMPLSSDPVNYGGEPYAYSDENIKNWLVIAEKGESDWGIVYPNKASSVVLKAANDLQEYIKKISGVTIRLASDTEKTHFDHAFYVGKTVYEGVEYEVDRSLLKAEGFLKSVQNENVILAGADDRGTLYAVNSFLEEQLGVRWFTTDLTVIPETDVVKCDAELHSIQNPYFEYRDVYWNEMFDGELKARHKINSHGIGWISDEYGGGIWYSDFCHSMERMVPESLFEQDETLFSYRISEGKYTTKQRCLTNPRVLELTIENARETIKKNGGQIMSITQNDNSDYCQCENCEAEAKRLGGQSGLNIWFVNQVARALKGEFPDVAFDTFAYQYTRQAPTVIIEGENTPDDNVIVRLCSIECCFCHPLEQCGHEHGEELSEYVQDKESTFAKDLKDWREICERLYIWDYTTNFKLYLMPFMNFHVLGANLQFFAENNVKGIFEQGNYTGGKSGEFGELRAYVLAKLVWDPYTDVEYHMMDFMKAYYGEESAEYIKEYIDIMTKKTVETSHLFIFNWHYENTFLRVWNTAPLDRLWDKAEKAAQNDEQLSNIQRSRLSLRFYKACMFVGEFGPLNLIGRKSENKKLYEDIIAHGVTRITEWSNIYQLKELDFYIRPIEWLDPVSMPWHDQLPPTVNF